MIVFLKIHAIAKNLVKICFLGMLFFQNFVHVLEMDRKRHLRKERCDSVFCGGNKIKGHPIQGVQSLEVSLDSCPAIFGNPEQAANIVNCYNVELILRMFLLFTMIFM